MPGRYLVGLMSGTSLDGVDAVLAREMDGGRLETVATLAHPFPAALRRRLLGLAQGRRVRLESLLRADVELGECYAEAVRDLLAPHPEAARRLTAIGSHGQTIRHRPTLGATLQIGDPARLAERTGHPVVADFRRADLAAGGQGAPLAPLFHRALLWRGEEALVVVNIGGMANLSLIGPDTITGFDSGPGNVLLDAWAQRHLGTPCDRDGAFAARGKVHAPLLDRLLAHPYFRRPPPKSTGREDFGPDWLDQVLSGFPGLAPADVQATLTELTARPIAGAIQDHAPGDGPVLVCGGGVHNRELMARLSRLLAPRPVQSTADRGVDPDFVEALGFAWLAARRLDAEAVDTTTVTGARHPVVLGAVYWPAGGAARSERGL